MWILFLALFFIWVYFGHKESETLKKYEHEKAMILYLARQEELRGIGCHIE